ncbi:sensor histidine kinase [Dokdonella sp. MW10]|uniref:sensor histidine kinase n=1 Tax=Dokdonella sp. MW10 TaxID=2992926 RepID=UPI003F7F5064
MVVTADTRSKRATTTRRDASLSRGTDTLIIDALPMACAMFRERDGKLVASNAAFRAAFDPDASIAGRAAFDAQFENAVEAGGDERARSEAFHPATRRWHELTWSAFVHAGEPCSVLTAIDITERQQALSEHKTQHERLLFTSRSMSVGEMATTLAHELNQPLAAIVNYLSVGMRLLERDGDRTRLGEALRYARAQAEHASQVIGRLREFVRAREPRREAYAPARLVDTVLRLLALEAERHRVRIEVDVPETLPDVHVDRVMVEQVLLNLMKNGIESMREASQRTRGLNVRALLNLDDQVEFRITDRGCGLTESAAERLFTPFFTTKNDGMGIGLAICRSIVEYHEGRLYFENNPAGGSVFVFTLPPSRD